MQNRITIVLIFVFLVLIYTIMSKNIGEKIRQIRDLKGLSQEYISGKLGISQRAYSKIERNEIKIDWEKITEISKIFEIDPMELISFDDNLIFNNCTQSGKFVNSQANFNVPEKLIEQYESRINSLEKELDFLRELIKQK
jgi:transcriptional regulator with XRE-family HTH domain